MPLLLTLNTSFSHFSIFLLLPQDLHGTDKCTLRTVAFTNFISVSYIYLHGQQKQLSSHTETGATGGGGSGTEGNNLIDLILGPFAFPL